LLRVFNTGEIDAGRLWGTTAMQVGIALSLLFLSNKFVIIRERTFLPSIFYLLFTGTDTLFFDSLTGCVASICILLCLYFLFDSYQSDSSQQNALNIALVLTIGSFFWQPLLFFFPVFWYGMYLFRCLNFRSFFATLIGLVVVYLFIFAWSFYKGDNSDIFLQYLPDWKNSIHFQIFQFDLREYLVMGFLFMLFVLTGVNIFISTISEKIKTLKLLNFLFVFSFLVFVLLFLQAGEKKEWSLILYLPLSFLLSHFFTLTAKKSVIWLMQITVLFFIGMYVWQVVSG
jgi:hypothetical protein